MLLVSVVICAHNPRKDFLRRVLEALRAQTLPKEQWELLLIDNASTERLAETTELAWHPAGRVVREETVGLTPARLKGIHEAKSDLLVFVDDDNALAADYLEHALRLSRDWPMLGAWGGSATPSFETKPQSWSEPYLRYLALREVNEDRWSNFTDQSNLLPWGAGLCVRRSVANAYARKLAAEPMRLLLDRRGNRLLCGGDSDLVLSACDLGLGTGLFKALKLTHLIPARRLTEDYLMKLTEGNMYSDWLFMAVNGKSPTPPSTIRVIRGHFMALFCGWRCFRFYRAAHRGTKTFFRDFASSRLTSTAVQW